MSEQAKPWESETAPKTAEAETSEGTSLNFDASKVAPTVGTKNKVVEESNSSAGKEYKQGKRTIVIGGQQASLALISLVNSGMTVAEAKAKLLGEDAASEETADEEGDE